MCTFCACSILCCTAASHITIGESVLDNVVVAYYVLTGKVKYQCRVDRLTKYSGLKVEVRARRTTSVATQADGLTSTNNLILLHDLLAQVTIECFKTIGVANDNIVAIATAIVFADTYFSIKCRADGVANIYLDVNAFMLTAPSWTIKRIDFSA